jgi:2-methylisocitrate lyase-like PEP mutase family enzyme
MMKSTTRLKDICQRREAVIMPGTPNPLFARVIQDLGFEAVYVTGAGISNMHLGVPDIGLVTLTELTEHVDAITDVVDIPVLVDADTGFGNPINMARTVRALERAGAAGIQIEDQVFPKKCGHFSGKAVISTEEMIQKIRAALDNRLHADFQIIARTDSRAIHGLDAAIDRAHRFIDAGADVTFVEAPRSTDEMQRIARELPAPQIANIVFGGLTPELDQKSLKMMGFGIVLYANAALQAALRGVYSVLNSLKTNGSLKGAAELLASFEERQRAVNKATFDELESRYRVLSQAHDNGDTP